MTTPPRLGTLLRNSKVRSDGLVPVIGSGLNIQASLIDDRTPADDWAGLLNAISEEIGLRDREGTEPSPSSFLARWEQLLIAWAATNNTHPYEAESQLQTLVVQRLRTLEAGASQYTLYREFAGAALPDIISLNFDRRVALSLDSERFVTGPSSMGGTPAQTLFRHSRLTNASGRSTRVWYPHGDTRRADTLKLGVRRYGYHLGILLEYLELQDGEWRSNRLWTEEAPSAPTFDAQGTESWVDIFLTRPLLFLGCGLAADEWSLWWLLRYRNDCAPALPAYFPSFYRPDPVVAAFGRNVGLRPVTFSSHSHLWDVIREAIA